MSVMQAEYEDARLRRSSAIRALDPTEREFEELAQLATTLCGTSMSMVVLLEDQRPTIKAAVGGDLRDRPGAYSFLLPIMEHGEVLTVSDASLDPQFRNSLFVTDEPHVRFLAGVPLETQDGLTIGALCVMDQEVRSLTKAQEHGLVVLARQTRARAELSVQRRSLEEAVREKDRIAAGLQASEELFRAFMNASPFLSYIKDAAGRLLFYNRSFARRFGVSEYAWLGRSDDQLWSRTMSAPMRVHDLEVMAGGRMVETEERIRGTDGTVTVWRTFKFPCHDSAGNALLAGVAVDVTEEMSRKAELERYQIELEEVNDQLRRLAVTDEMTGLRNRRAFEERLVMEFSMARRRKRELAVLLLDVDDFKHINDRYGHGAGDDVLRRLGSVLRTTVRLPDLVARYGGEEFVVLLPESGEQSAMGLAGRLLERLANESWEHQKITVSVGVAAMDESHVNGYQMVHQADEALYAAKRAGKNRVVVYGGEKRR